MFHSHIRCVMGELLIVLELWVKCLTNYPIAKTFCTTCRGRTLLFSHFWWQGLKTQHSSRFWTSASPPANLLQLHRPAHKRRPPPTMDTWQWKGLECLPKIKKTLWCEWVTAWTEGEEGTERITANQILWHGKHHINCISMAIKGKRFLLFLSPAAFASTPSSPATPSNYLLFQGQTCKPTWVTEGS